MIVELWSGNSENRGFTTFTPVSEGFHGDMGKKCLEHTPLYVQSEVQKSTLKFHGS